MRRDAGEVDGLPDGGQDEFRPSERIGRRRVAVEQDPELVPAQSPARVGGANRGSQPAGNLLEDLVADRVPQAVVHSLEAVEAN